MNKIREVSFTELARHCQTNGDRNGFWRAFRQHRRVQRKLREQRKALTVYDTVKGS